jgi:hypothetical protein
LSQISNPPFRSHDEIVPELYSLLLIGKEDLAPLSMCVPKIHDMAHMNNDCAVLSGASPNAPRH